MAQQWGPAAGQPTQPLTPKGKGPSGCALAFFSVWAAGGLLYFFMSLGLQMPAMAVVSLIIGVGPPAAYFIVLATRPGRERTEQQVRQDVAAKQHQTWLAARPDSVAAKAQDPHAAAMSLTASQGGGIYLGLTPDRREWSTAAREQAVLVLGPPRSGKTSGLIVPAILSASGPAVVTSTKLDVLDATKLARGRLGRIWVFDPTQSYSVPEGATALHWTPVTSARTWDGARTIADAMVDSSQAGAGVENASHWTESAKTILAPLLRAAYLDDCSISVVRRWISRPDYYRDEVLRILTEHDQFSAIEDVAAILESTEERERSSICSTARLVLNAYGSDAVAAVSQVQNFKADEFAASCDTVYIVAPSDAQNIAAPLVVGLLEEIRHATYRANATINLHQHERPPMLWALDEVANIAPIKKLPSIVSESGGQGLQVMACFQDLSQARVRWKEAADGFLTLFGTKVVFPGIGDVKTLDALSTLAGDWDRPYVVYNSTSGRSTSFGLPLGGTIGSNTSQSTTHSVQRERQLTAATLANIPAGNALTLRSGNWGLIQCTPYYRDLPWKSISSGEFLERAQAAVTEPAPVKAVPPLPAVNPYLSQYSARPKGSGLGRFFGGGGGGGGAWNFGPTIGHEVAKSEPGPSRGARDGASDVDLRHAEDMVPDERGEQGTVGGKEG
ncbi:type IV secretory system conjugative DNA transfer family protein [Kineococcus rubinsiae]|uniref:type IV secretory system conjugative DNA transfer family protein n=1 Tax=Kineococcus rubinsiae TaxID=2609562 RepID=UPI001430472E|nr:type IV secretory system conjugative DNA transfer family protein [Kineococcus rubinsiae]NIZ90290.1 type IV secretory system conjugative DNA transfer family protein [Kineococcus rubinsiae]